MTIAILGFGVQFQIGDGGSPQVFTTLEELVDASPPGVSRAPVDGTHMGAEARFMLFLSGLRDGGEIPLVFHYTPETYEVLIDEYLIDAVRKYRVVGPDGYFWEFDGLITQLEAPPPIDDVWEINVTIKVSGKPSYNSPPVAPDNTIPPTISGDELFGSLLTATPGTWTGSPVPTLTYQWMRDGVAISGATGSTYTTVEDDVDTTVTVVVTATNSEGSASATSNGIAVDGPPAWPQVPLFLLDPETGDSRGIPNTATDPLATVSKNIFTWSKAEIRNNGSATLPAVTRFSSSSAARLLWSNTSNVFSFWSSTTNGVPPAGDYTARFRAKSNTASSQNVRVGSTASPASTATKTLTTSWQTFTHAITTSGSDYATFGIYNDGAGNLPDILIDEIEVYLTSELPASFEDTRNWAHRRRANLSGTTLYAADGSLDNTQNAGTANAGIYGVIQAPEALTATADTTGYQLNEWTYLVIPSASAAAAVANVLLGTETNANLGTTGNTLQFGLQQTTGRPTTLPLNFGVSEMQTLGTGYHIFGARTKNGERAVNYGRWMMSWDDNAYTGFKVRNFLHGGTATTTQYNGKEALLVFWDKYLTDAEWDEAVEMAEYLMDQRALALSKREWGYIGAGDSITAGPSISTSYASLQGIGFNFDGGTYNLPMRNVGVSGYGITDIENMLSANNSATSFAVGPGGILARIAEMIADDMQPIVSLMIGVNDSSLINSGGVPAFYTRLKAIWATLRAAGAKVIGITNLPANVGNNWETNRLALRTSILADAPTLLDGVVDFGDPTSFMGNSANLSNTTYWNADQLHPLALGHSTYLAPLMKAGIISVGVPA